MTTVVFLETELRLGGTEKVVTQLIERLDRTKFRPILCCVYRPGVLGEKLKEKGIPVVSGLSKSRWDLRVGWHLFQLLRREKADVLFIVNQPLLQFWGTWCGLLANVPVRIVSIRNIGKMTRANLRRWVHRLTSPGLTRIAALSEGHRSLLKEQYQLPDHKIEVVANGVDMSRFEQTGSGYPLRGFEAPAGVPVVGLVAMLRPEKNPTMFLMAAKEVLADVPDALFVLAGDGPERGKLEELVDLLELGPHVHFLGARDDVPAVLHRLDVAVLSSDREGLPNAVLEYMAASKPVVATAVGCVPEIVEEGKTGFLVPPGDWKAMAGRISFLLKNRKAAQEMGLAGREKVKTFYTVEQMVSRTENMFENLLQEA